MPKINWDAIEDTKKADYDLLPDGSYVCVVKDCIVKKTQKGDEFYSLVHQVMEGSHAGRLIFDALFFSEAALKRVKLVSSRLGIETKGAGDLKPSDLIGKKAYVEVKTDSYVAKDGKLKHKNVVPFDGYSAYSGKPSAAPIEDDDIPF